MFCCGPRVSIPVSRLVFRVGSVHGLYTRGSEEHVFWNFFFKIFRPGSVPVFSPAAPHPRFSVRFSYSNSLLEFSLSKFFFRIFCQNSLSKSYVEISCQNLQAKCIPLPFFWQDFLAKFLVKFFFQTSLSEFFVEILCQNLLSEFFVKIFCESGCPPTTKYIPSKKGIVWSMRHPQGTQPHIHYHICPNFLSNFFAEILCQVSMSEFFVKIFCQVFLSKLQNSSSKLHLEWACRILFRSLLSNTAIVQ